MFHFPHFMTAFAAFFSGMFGGGHASGTPPMMPPAGFHEDASSSDMMGDNNGLHLGQGLSGVVTAVGSTTITVNGVNGRQQGDEGDNKNKNASTTYSVDASSAKIIKGSATSTATIASIAVGDRVVVLGQVTGTSTIKATTIIDGRVMMGQMFHGQMMGGDGRWATGTSPRGGDEENASGTEQENDGHMMSGMPPRGPMMGGHGDVETHGPMMGTTSVNAEVEVGGDR